MEAFVTAGAQIVTVHCEATVHLQRTLAMIRECGGKAGVALNPSTPLEAIQYVLDDIDLLLIMTVNPGFGGQSLIPATIQKVRLAKELIVASGREIELEVDGGIGVGNIGSLANAGATVFVAGTSIFGHVGGISSGIASLREAAAKGS